MDAKIKSHLKLPRQRKMLLKIANNSQFLKKDQQFYKGHHQYLKVILIKRVTHKGGIYQKFIQNILIATNIITLLH
jgi:hypothetical protein